MPEALAQAKDASFSSDDLLADAARRVMAKHTRKLYQHLPGVLSGDDPHDIHQARVATRRLRACMEATLPAFREQQIQELRRSLRRLARALGEVRDRDVLGMRFERDAQQYPESDRLPLLEIMSRIAKERAAAHQALLQELGRKRTTRMLNELNNFLLRPLEKVQAQGELPLLVRHYAGSAMLRRYEEVRQWETLLPGATSEQLHELRIACKHLRYTLELFEPALPETVGAVTGVVTEMQEHLGNLHDADVALAYLGVDLVEPVQDVDEMIMPDASSNGVAPHAESPDEALGENVVDEPVDVLEMYIRQRREQRTQLIDGVLPLWNRLTNLTNRHKLAGGIATL
jgi:CHAD domain-containing protein